MLGLAIPLCQARSTPFTIPLQQVEDGRALMSLLCRSTVVVVSMLCGVFFSPERANANRIDPDSDTLSTFSLTGFNKDKLPVLGTVKDGTLSLPEPGDKKDSGEKNSLAVAKIAFNFTELDKEPSDELTFDPFTIKFFSDLPPPDLPEGIKIVRGGTESTSEGLMLMYPLVEFKMDSENRAEKKGTDESDTLRIVTATYKTTGTLDFADEKKPSVLKGTIPAQAIEFFEPDGKTVSDVVVIGEIKFVFESDAETPLKSNGGTQILESQANAAKLGSIISLKIASDAEIPEPATLWLILLPTVAYCCRLARRNKLSCLRGAGCHEDKSRGRSDFFMVV